MLYSENRNLCQAETRPRGKAENQAFILSLAKDEGPS